MAAANCSFDLYTSAEIYRFVVNPFDTNVVVYNTVERRSVLQGVSLSERNDFGRRKQPDVQKGRMCQSDTPVDAVLHFIKSLSMTQLPLLTSEEGKAYRTECSLGYAHPL